jgi:hypothetical protein
MTYYEIRIDRTDMGLGPLVLSGRDGTQGWFIMPNLQLPGLEPETATVSSQSTHGSSATATRYLDSVISGDLLPEADDYAGVTALVNEFAAATSRLSYPVVTSWKGYEQTWVAQPARLVPSPIDWPEIDRDQPVFSFAIPVYPLPS